jgi:hypothetical protein
MAMMGLSRTSGWAVSSEPRAVAGLAPTTDSRLCYRPLITRIRTTSSASIRVVCKRPSYLASPCGGFRAGYLNYRHLGAEC